MEAITQWIISLVVICAVGAIILYLSPTSSVQKSVKTVVVLCVLLTFAMPFVKMNIKDIDYSNIGFSEEKSIQSAEITEQMKRYAELEAEELCDSFVKESDCYAQKIEAEADIDEENCIYISEVVLTMSEKNKPKMNDINEKIKGVFNIDGVFIWQKE